MLCLKELPKPSCDVAANAFAEQLGLPHFGTRRQEGRGHDEVAYKAPFAINERINLGYFHPFDSPLVLP